MKIRPTNLTLEWKPGTQHLMIGLDFNSDEDAFTVYEDLRIKALSGEELSLRLTCGREIKEH